MSEGHRVTIVTTTEHSQGIIDAIRRDYADTISADISTTVTGGEALVEFITTEAAAISSMLLIKAAGATVYVHTVA